jgi:ribosome-associated protein
MKGRQLATTHSRKAEKPASTAQSRAAAQVALALSTVVTSLEDAKAEDILPIDIKGKSALADHMVIASGRSHRHVAAIADQLITAIKEAGFGNPRIEGKEAADWVLIDAGDVIVHVFRPEVRSFYNIEKMWQAPDLDPQSLH